MSMYPGESMLRHYCWYDEGSHRFVLQGKELHCGDCFQVRIGETWHDVRIEMSGPWDKIGSWYLVGVPGGHRTHPDAYEARLHQQEAA